MKATFLLADPNKFNDDIIRRYNGAIFLPQLEPICLLPADATLVFDRIPQSSLRYLQINTAFRLPCPKYSIRRDTLFYSSSSVSSGLYVLSFNSSRKRKKGIFRTSLSDSSALSLSASLPRTPLDVVGNISKTTSRCASR
jgi:hypothetical protein